MQESISIHALREEGDVLPQEPVRDEENFYPRPPRGGRPGLGYDYYTSHKISIHALREEGDRMQTAAMQR